MSTVTAPANLTGTYTIDPTHSRIGFVARHAMVTKVRGSFNEFDGDGYFDAENPQDSHLRIAPTYPSLSEVETASMLLTVCVRLAVVEKLLAE